MTIGERLARASWDLDTSPDMWLAMYGAALSEAQTDEDKQALRDMSEMAHKLRTMPEDARKIVPRTQFPQ